MSNVFDPAFLNQALYLTGWFFAFYVYFGLGITLGYHRLLTHRSVKLPKWLEYLVVSGGYFCLMGSPVVWVGVHRLHHQKSDMPGDPHSPRDGFYHALVGWMFEMGKYQTEDELKRAAADLMKDPVYRRLGHSHEPAQAILCLSTNVAWRVAIGLIFGWGVVAVNVLALGIVFLATQCVNAVCHLQTAGYRNFETREDSRNVWWVAILSLGEGWHNNHHAIPKSAQHGMNWWEFDFTWMTICFFEKLGLGKDVFRPPVTRMPGASGTKAVAFNVAEIPVELEIPKTVAVSRKTLVESNVKSD